MCIFGLNFNGSDKRRRKNEQNVKKNETNELYI